MFICVNLRFIFLFCSGAIFPNPCARMDSARSLWIRVSAFTQSGAAGEIPAAPRVGWMMFAYGWAASTRMNNFGALSKLGLSWTATVWVPPLTGPGVWTAPVSSVQDTACRVVEVRIL